MKIAERLRVELFLLVPPPFHFGGRLVALPGQLVVPLFVLCDQYARVDVL